MNTNYIFSVLTVHNVLRTLTQKHLNKSLEVYKVKGNE